MTSETTPDVIVVGAGISGLAYAWKAASAGRSVLVLEREPRVGGCIHSHREGDGHWFEMGAHTVYNSYGGFLDMAVGTGAAERLVQRGPARTRFGLLKDGEVSWLTPPKVLLKLNWLEAALRFPFGIFGSKEGKSVESYYSKLIGPGNFSRVVSPFFAAVPSQSADAFPMTGAGSLFKKRPRREDFPRSFGFAGGLQTVCDAVVGMDGVTVHTGVAVQSVRRRDGGFTVTAADGGQAWQSAHVAVALPLAATPPVLRDDFGELSQELAKIATVGVESMGVVLPREACWMPECAFVVPVDDLFFSAVTRDAFPDDARRAFAFHFRPGVERERKLARIAEVLRVEVEALGEPIEQRLTLPAPAVGHDGVVETIDGLLAGARLALVGNYFDGLAIEDCIQRAFSEWSRVEAQPAAGLAGAPPQT